MSISKTIMTAVSKMDRATLNQLQALMNVRKEELAIEVKRKLKVGDYVTVNHKKLAGQKCIVTEVRTTRASVKTKYGSYNVPMTLITPVKLTAKEIEALQEAAAYTFSKWG
jgi:transcription antitermination factor NusG